MVWMKTLFLGPASGQFFVARVRSGRVRHLWVCKHIPLKNKFTIFPLGHLVRLGQKIPGAKTGQPLFYCGSKVCSGWVGSGSEPIFGGHTLARRSHKIEYLSYLVSNR